MRALVTGGAGFIGSHLVDALVARGDEVIVIDNLHRPGVGHLRSRLDAGDHVTLLTGDIRDYPALLEAMAGAEVVYHLAAQSNVVGAVEDIDYSFTTNVQGTLNVLEAARARGVRRVVYASSREVYGEQERVPVPESAPLLAKNFYGASKVSGEAYCRAYERMGLDVTVLRLVNLYGPGDAGRVTPRWLDNARSGADLELFGGDQVLDFLPVGRAVEAIVAAAERSPNGPVNVGSGKGVTLFELAERILRLTGSRSTIERRPAREFEVVRFVADVGRMRDVLGLQPPDDPLEALPEIVTVGAGVGG